LYYAGMRKELLDAIKNEADKVNRLISKFLQGDPEGLYRSARYLLDLGGKRLRPFVTIMCGKMLEAEEEPLYLSALGVELLHNFTLVHDDIIDRDEYRRGHPTVHKVFGEAIAILAGDLLFSKAFEAVSLAEKASNAKGVVYELIRAATKLDEGQYLDVSFENQENIEIEQYLHMIGLKTGALYEASAVIGGLIGKIHDEEKISALARYGKNLGLCFQIRDDYLGVFGDPSKTGKPVGNDIKRGKRTAVTILAKKLADEQTLQLMKTISDKDRSDHVTLSKIVDGLKQKRVDAKCMELARGFVAEATRALSVFPDSPQKKLLEDLAIYSFERES